MVISGWILLATAAVVVCVVVFLCLVIRRALTELFFWRGAYRVTSDHASELLAQAERGASTRQPGTGAPCDAASPLQRYEAAVDSVRCEAARLKIDWVSDDDGAYFRAQHDVAAPEAADRPVNVVSRITEYATRR